MRCKYCGSSVEENDAFCQTCGRSLSADADPVQPETSVQVTEEVSLKRDEVEEAVKNSRNGIAVASLILGILSICCCSMFTAPSGIILAILGLKSNSKGMAIAGIILNILAVLVFIISFGIGFIMAIEDGIYSDIFGSYGF